jgi:Tol biopolymer transport system component
VRQRRLSEPLPVVPDTDADGPSVSADGTRVAYWTLKPDGTRSLYRAPADGSAAPLLLATVTLNGSYEAPVFSPDGQWIY